MTVKQARSLLVRLSFVGAAIGFWVVSPDLVGRIVLGVATFFIYTGVEVAVLIIGKRL